MEQCRVGATKGVLHYVLRRKIVRLAQNDNFELEICVKPRGGRAARCMGTPPVAEMLASEARRDRTRGVRGVPRTARTTTPLYGFSRAIDGESHAGVGNSLKLISQSPFLGDLLSQKMESYIAKSSLKIWRSCTPPTVSFWT